MANNHFSNKEVVIGVAVGGLILSLGALLLAPTGKKMRSNLSDMYDDISDKTHEVTDSMIKKTKRLMHINCEEPDWKDKAKCLMSDMCDYMSCCKKRPPYDVSCDMFETQGSHLMIGVLAGGIVGAVAGLLIAPKPGDKLRHDFAEAYDDVSDKTHEFADTFQKTGKKFVKTAKKRANKWLDLAQTVINEFTDNSEQLNENITEKVKNYADSGKEKIDQALEWASLGLRIWKGLSK